MPKILAILTTALTVLSLAAANAEPQRPNILFIALDDLNDWIEPLGGHPQAKTPNMKRLAASGVLFDNAHCPAPACNPCRTAITITNTFVFIDLLLPTQHDTTPIPMPEQWNISGASKRQPITARGRATRRPGASTTTPNPNPNGAT